MASSDFFASPKSISVLDLKKTGLSTPAYPLAMERFMKIVCLDCQTCDIARHYCGDAEEEGGSYLDHGHACDGALGIFFRGAVDSVIRAHDQRHVHFLDDFVRFFHLLDHVIRHTRFRQQHIQLTYRQSITPSRAHRDCCGGRGVPGMRPATG